MKWSFLVGQHSCATPIPRLIALTIGHDSCLFWAKRSSCFPLPQPNLFKTMMRSAFATVTAWASVTRCAPRPHGPMSLISCSVSVSSADVASSNNRIGGFFNRVRAIPTRCFSPPIPATLPHFGFDTFGSDMMKSWIWAFGGLLNLYIGDRGHTRCCNKLCR